MRVSAAACLEGEDVQGNGGGKEYHCKFEPEPGKDEEHAMDGCEPKGGYGNDLSAQGDGLILTETFYVANGMRVANRGRTWRRPTEERAWWAGPAGICR